MEIDSCMSDARRVLAYNVNRLVQAKFAGERLRDYEIAKRLGMARGTLSRLRRLGKPATLELLEELAPKLDALMLDFFVPPEYDATDVRDVTASVTGNRGKTTALASSQLGGDHVSHAALRARVSLLESELAHLIGVSEAEAKRMRGLLHGRKAVATAERTARAKALPR